MGAYKESDDHKPEPTALSGTFDTSDSGGSGHYTRVENLAPIFGVAKAHNLHVAARALDPDDDGVSEMHVQRSTAFTVSQGDPEGDKRRLLERAEREGNDASGLMAHRRTDEAMAQWRHEVEAMRPAEEAPDGSVAVQERPSEPEATEEPQEREEPSEAPSEPPVESPAAHKRPSTTDPKAAWVAYAQSVATDSDETVQIDEMTKAELVAKYGSR